MKSIFSERAYFLKKLELLNDGSPPFQFPLVKGRVFELPSVFKGVGNHKYPRRQMYEKLLKDSSPSL